MKAIETCYGGYRFRSRLEARWAVFFDSMRVRWQYEPEGYELKSGRYLPDFWLPDCELWVEIKGGSPTARELLLCEQLADLTDHPVVLCSGMPGERMRVYCSDCTDGSGGTMWWDEDDIEWAHGIEQFGVLIPYPNHVWLNPSTWGDATSLFSRPDEIIRTLDGADFAAARGARFEFSR